MYRLFSAQSQGRSERRHDFRTYSSASSSLLHKNAINTNLCQMTKYVGVRSSSLIAPFTHIPRKVRDRPQFPRHPSRLVHFPYLNRKPRPADCVNHTDPQKLTENSATSSAFSETLHDFALSISRMPCSALWKRQRKKERAKTRADDARVKIPD